MIQEHLDLPHIRLRHRHRQVLANAARAQASASIGSGFPIARTQWGDVACSHALIERREDPATLRDCGADGYASAEEYRRWSLTVRGSAL